MGRYLFIFGALSISFSAWAAFDVEPEEILAQMSLEQKVGQLFIVPACQLRAEDHLEDLERLITQYHIGGIILKQGTIAGQIQFINTLQAISETPLLCVQDAEWGLNMRLSDAICFPKNLTLGAIHDSDLIYDLGREIGRECRVVGTHMNLSPVADINTNPNNPVIHTRSFGEDPICVRVRAWLMMYGMLDENVMTCAKHFPGHGDTSVDSHRELPVLLHSKERLSIVEWLPFYLLLRTPSDAVMTGHLAVPSITSNPDLPATLSKEVVDLIKGWNYPGLIITDALNMAPIVANYSAQEAALLAYKAGHHLLLYGDHIAPRIDVILRQMVPEAYNALLFAFQNHELSIDELNERVLKILKAKAKHDYAPSSGENPVAEVNSVEAFELKRRLYETAVTLLKNENEAIPIVMGRTAVVKDALTTPFVNDLAAAVSVDDFSVDEPDLFEKLAGYDRVVVAFADLRLGRPQFGLPEGVSELIEKLRARMQPVIIALMATPYSLAAFPSCDAVVVGYEADRDAQRACAHVILGQLNPMGRIPISILPEFPLELTDGHHEAYLR